MSLVTEVLESAGAPEDIGSLTQLPAVERRLRELQHEILDSLGQRFDKVPPLLMAATALADRSQAILSELNDARFKLQKELEQQLDITGADVQDQLVQLQESEASAVVLQHLVTANTHLTAIRSAVKSNRLVEAAEKISLLKETLLKLDELPSSKELKVLAALQEECRIQKTQLMAKLVDSWDKIVEWSNTDDDSKQIDLKILSNESNVNEKLREILLAMSELNTLNQHIVAFGERILQRLVRRSLSKSCRSVESVRLGGAPRGYALRLTFDDTNEPMDPCRCLQQLIDVLLFLNKHILCVKLHSETTASLLSSTWGKRLVDMIISQCLAESIPRNAKALERYDTVIEQANKLQKLLLDCELLARGDEAITEYTRNVNVLFASKRTQELLSQARRYMTRELHETVRIGPNAPFGELSADRVPSCSSELRLVMAADSDAGQDGLEVSAEKQLRPTALQLPDAQISVGVQELLLLAYKTLDEAAESGGDAGRVLFSCVRHMFELFCDVTPTAHRQIAHDIPLASALLNNNCIFLSHHLLTIGHVYKERLSAIVPGMVSLIDLVPLLRQVGSDVFLAQMRKQRDTILELLQAAHGFNDMQESNHKAEAERAIRQCLHQLSQISRVWLPVLPKHVFNKALGTLINTLTKEVISSIVSQEDIQADAASRLHELIDLLLDTAPGLLAQSSDESSSELSARVQQNVKNWQRLTELQLLLDANLQSITERWSDGMGPLATQFTPEEVRGLIRALFSNTDRRAKALTKIK